MAKLKIITLDAKENSSLAWDSMRTEALSSIAAGYQILWNLDLGLFDQLSKPLSVSAQFLTLGLALDHFKDKLWKEFHRFSLGAALYQGPANFLQTLRWDEGQKNNYALWLQERAVTDDPFVKQLYGRDVCAEYLEQLAGRLPDEISPYIIFNSLPDDALLTALLTDPERFGRIKLYTSHKWKTEQSYPLGICMPPLSAVNPEKLSPLRTLLTHLQGQEYKLIPESSLTNSWDGLDTLIYIPELMTYQGQRKLRGFEAAGGTTISIHDWLTI